MADNTSTTSKQGFWTQKPLKALLDDNLHNLGTTLLAVRQELDTRLPDEKTSLYVDGPELADALVQWLEDFDTIKKRKADVNRTGENMNIILNDLADHLVLVTKFFDRMHELGTDGDAPDQAEAARIRLERVYRAAFDSLYDSIEILDAIGTASAQHTALQEILDKKEPEVSV